MEKMDCISALGALAHETRLDVFRCLVKAGQDGLLPSEISQTLGVLQNTLSTHLAILHRAGLVTNRREGRTIRYLADMDGMRRCLGYLMEDCCGGRPELCQPVIRQLACAC
ncbi:MAG TPA: metalloregulator ArsR/SmtB family transcription factor [Paracoccaceae bacterium]|nr:metalloregulator ArsR/SmtB family transcription factor [Paracoccaceae bacterium]